MYFNRKIIKKKKRKNNVPFASLLEKRKARRNAIIEIRKLHPEYTLNVIGFIFGCSRQYISQLLIQKKKEDLTKKIKRL